MSIAQGAPELPPVAGHVCLNGTLMPAQQATISVFDHGFLFGDGVFETLRTYGGVPFRLDAHLERLGRSLAVLRMQHAPSSSRLRAEVQQTLEASGLADATIRITITRGRGLKGLDIRRCPAPTVLVAALPLKEYPPSVYQRGARAVSLWRRSTEDRPPLSVKSTSYQRAVLARAQVADVGADEGLYLDEDGCVTEGTVSNVFAHTEDGVLWTPPTDRCLPGITRAEVLAIAAERGMEVREAPLPVDALLSATEAFVTSSLSEVLPLVALDDRAVGDGAPGPLAASLRVQYRARAEPGR